MIENNLKTVFEFIKNGNNLGEKVSVVGATKMVDVDTINLAVENGLKIVAENRVQEFREKNELISKKAVQHFIGHLQTNKIKYLVGKIELIHSVDSLHLAEEIDKYCKNKNLVQNVLIEINIGGELSKSGFDFSNAKENIKKINDQYKNLKVLGLMAMLPKTDDEKTQEELCKKMRALYDEMIGLGFDFKFLSIGMSNDYKVAVKNGSNMIRLGRTIFGERNYGGNYGSF